MGVKVWRQGSTIPDWPVGETLRRAEGHTTFAHWRRTGRLEDFPALMRATKPREDLGVPNGYNTAQSIRVEWLYDRVIEERVGILRRKRTRIERHTDHNYTQIFRTYHRFDDPFPDMDEIASKMDELRELMCRDINKAIVNGVRSYRTDRQAPWATMGGYKDILGRNYSDPEDQLVLAVLREPRFAWETFADGDVVIDWLCEVSLRAYGKR